MLLTFQQANCQSNMISLNGEKYYINGINIPWNNFGWDFGSHDEWGEGYDSIWFESTFTELKNYGVNCARIWIHCDGRANPNFDEQGFVIGLDENFLDQLQNMVELAEKHSIMLVLTLWSHDMLEDYTNVAGSFGGLHKDLIVDAAKTNSYIEHALVPMVKRLNQHCNILAWEIMNEPEWCMDVGYGGTTYQTVSKEEMQLFIGKCIAAIRQYSNQNITISAAKSFGNVDGMNTNFWHDSEFHKLEFDCSEVYLDFYCFHYYDYMGNNESPFLNEASTWELNKPILITEIASHSNNNNGTLTPKEQLDLSFQHNYAGVMFWSFNAEDAYSDWGNCKEELDVFSNQHIEHIQYEGVCDSIFRNTPPPSCSFYPNPASSNLTINIHLKKDMYSFNATIYNSEGRIVKSFFSNESSYKLWIDDLYPGFYYISIDILNQRKELIQNRSEKLIITSN